jgi:hypothetical protein
MVRQTMNRLVSTTLLGMMMMCGNLVAQPAASGVPNGVGQTAQSQKAAQTRANLEGNPSCQRILAECKRLGFVYGQWKKDNGLYKDCFDPVVRGGTATRDGKPINVPVSPNEIQSCRAAAHHR